MELDHCTVARTSRASASPSRVATARGSCGAPAIEVREAILGVVKRHGGRGEAGQPGRLGLHVGRTGGAVARQPQPEARPRGDENGMTTVETAAQEPAGRTRVAGMAIVDQIRDGRGRRRGVSDAAGVGPIAHGA